MVHVVDRFTTADPEPGDEDRRRDAIAWAASFRRRREELRRQVSSGRRSLLDVLASADTTDDGGVRLLFALESLPGARKVETRRHLARLGLSETAQLRDLTPEERELLLAEFPLTGDRSSTVASSPEQPS